MEVELTENAIPTMWSGANNEMAYTVQILKYIHMGEGKGYKIHVSDGKTFTLLLINSKPEIAEMIVEKGEGLINSIGLIEVKSSPHPKNAGQKLLFLQTLKILQEGVQKIGEPVKFESENQAKKDTDTPKQGSPSTSVTTPQTLVKSESKTHLSPAPKGPGLVTPDNSPPKAELNMSQSADKCVPIAQLNMYQRPTIKGSIVNKDSLRAFDGKDGSKKKVFSCEIVDSTSDMKVTFWDKAADKFYEALEVGKTYTFSKISLKMTNSKFNSTKCPYEMSVAGDSVIEVCDDVDAPKMTYQFVSIDRLEEKINKNCDLIGVVQEVSQKGDVQLKNGKGSKAKRNVTIVDQSNKAITLTLWDQLADEVLEGSGTAHDVIAIRAVRVSDYNGCSVNSTRSSIVSINPVLPEATKLKEWYTSGGDKATFSSVSSAGGSGGGGGTAARKYISDIEKEGLGTTPDKASYFELKCSIVMATAAQPSEANEKKRAWCYAANPENKKKVVEEGDGWRDESTNPATYLAKCQRRYISNFKFMDETGGIYMTCFDDECQRLLGLSADDLFTLEMEGKMAEFKDAWKKPLFTTHIIKVRAKTETYEDKSRVKCSIVSMQPLNFANESKSLLERIQMYGV